MRVDEWRALRDTRLRALADAPDAFGTTYAEARARPEQWWRNWTERSATGTAQAMFLAWDGDEPTGIAGAFRETSYFLVISMWTDPRRRGRGIGHALLDAAISFAGDEDVVLGVTEGNDAARRLYESYGFVATGATEPASPERGAAHPRASAPTMRELDPLVERAVGSTPVGYRAQGGGYSSADRFIVALADGRTVFVKSAAPPHMAGWLRREHEMYANLEGSFIPRLEGWHDDGVRPVLAIEDLSGADWVPRWDAARIEAVRAALAELGASAAPPNTKPVGESFADLFGRWQVVAENPAPFLSLGLRGAGWLERNLGAILEAAEAAPVAGHALCHLDVRSDNLSFRAGVAVLVDWNLTSFANPDVDLAAWLPSVRVEGGPQPWQVLPEAGELAAFVAGVWAAVAALPAPETAPAVRPLQRAQLAVALDWIDRELELG